jgi:REP element-mobilizing transposase RayT
MANTYTQIYVQVIFAVESRQALIRPENKEELHKYITGIVRNKGQKLLSINGRPDHLHILLGIEPDLALSDLVREVKKSSTAFINKNRWVKGRFNWQEGFGGFSYSKSGLDAVIRYIQNQDQHHAKRSFKDEYMHLLRKFDVAFEERYLFDFADEEPKDGVDS